MKICKSCGQEVESDAKFCPYCGIAVPKRIAKSKKTQYMFIIRWISIIIIFLGLIFILVMVWIIRNDSDHASAEDLGMRDKEIVNEAVQNDSNVMNYHYKIKNIYYWGNQEDSITEDEQFWVKAEHILDDGNSAIEYVLTDTSAHIYRTIESDVLDMGNELLAIISLPNGRTALGYTGTDTGYRKYWYNYRIFVDTDEKLTDISDQFFDEDETIWYILKDGNGIKIFTYKTIDSYSYQDVIINVYDGYLNKTFSFSKTELSDKYNLGSISVEKLFLTPIGGDIYCMMPNNSNNALFIDTARNKVFVMETTVKGPTGVFNPGSFSSDGDYIICSENSMSIIDIDYETEIINTAADLEGFHHIKFEGYGSYSYNAHLFSAIREGKFFGKSADFYSHYGLFDYTGSQIAVIDYADSVLSNYSLFYNGHAVLELENSGGVTFVTIIDDKGNWLFEPISGNLGGGKTCYFKDIDCFLIFSNDGNGGYLLNTQGKQQQLSSIPSEGGLFFHLTSINGEQRIIYFDKQSEMMLAAKEVISVD